MMKNRFKSNSPYVNVFFLKYCGLYSYERVSVPGSHKYKWLVFRP